MHKKIIKNRSHPVRLLSILWLFSFLYQSGIAMAETTTTSQHQKTSVTNKQTTPKQKPSTDFRLVESFPALLKSGALEIKDIPNPHWNKKACIACHRSTKINASKKNLRNKAVEKTCYNCHSPLYDHRYIHPAEVQPDKKMLARMDTSMRKTLAKNNNTITCTTCHDLSLQCSPEHKKQASTNPKFFRNGPHQSRSQLCYLCHDKNQYQRLDPHDQIDQQGKLRPEKCRICHADSVERLDKVTDINQLEFNSEQSLSAMCWGCHPWTPHPGGQFTFFKSKTGPDHLVKPNKNIKQRLDEMTQKKLIDFPLEPDTGKVFCGTCHNVHEKGVIKNPEKAKGADSKKRLRDQQICTYCHLK